MSNFNKISTLALVLASLLPASLQAQSIQTKQIIVANGGKFEFAAPFEDYVTLSSYNPVSQQSTTFATVYTQSIQDVQIDNGTLFLAAQDSIVRYNLDTYQKTGKATYNAIRKLQVTDSKLLVGKFYGSGAFFHIYDKTTLQPLHAIAQISNEVKDIAVIGDTAYISHNLQSSTYMDSVGYIGVVKISTGQFIQNISLGQRGAGIGRLFVKGKSILGVANTRRLLYEYSPATAAITVDSIGVRGGTNLIGNTLYANFKRGIGSYDVQTKVMIDTVIVDTTDIVASVFDKVNNRFYVTQTDFMSFIGSGIYNLNGNKIGRFNVGFSPEAIAIDYRQVTALSNSKSSQSLKIYPNPANEQIWVQSDAKWDNNTLVIRDITGKEVLSQRTVSNEPISVAELAQGIYVVEISHEGQIFRSRFVKQ